MMRRMRLLTLNRRRQGRGRSRTTQPCWRSPPQTARPLDIRAVPRATEMSAWEWGTSPARGGSKMGCGSAPAALPMAARSSNSVNRPPQPMLQVKPATSPVVAARRLASTTLSTCVKSREASPAPLTIGCSFRRTAVTNRGTTAAYSDAGSWPGAEDVEVTERDSFDSVQSPERVQVCPPPPACWWHRETADLAAATPCAGAPASIRRSRRTRQGPPAARRVVRRPTSPRSCRLR